MCLPRLLRTSSGICCLLALLCRPTLGAPDAWTGSLLNLSCAPPSYQCVAIGDVDGDGTPDLVGLARGAVNSLCVLLNKDGKLHPSPSRLCPGLEFYAHATVRAALCDENRDGLPDLKLGGASHQEIAVFLNRGQLHGEWQGLAEAR